MCVQRAKFFCEISATTALVRWHVHSCSPSFGGSWYEYTQSQSQVWWKVVAFCISLNFSQLMFMSSSSDRRSFRAVGAGGQKLCGSLLICTLRTEHMLSYLMNSCTPTADVAGHQHLRSASQRNLIVPHYHLHSYGRRCFAVAGPSTWNSLPDSLRDTALSLNIFMRQLKRHFFAKYWQDVLSTLEIFWECAI